MPHAPSPVLVRAVVDELLTRKWLSRPRVPKAPRVPGGGPGSRFNPDQPRNLSGDEGGEWAKSPTSKAYSAIAERIAKVMHGGGKGDGRDTGKRPATPAPRPRVGGGDADRPSPARPDKPEEPTPPVKAAKKAATPRKAATAAATKRADLDEPLTYEARVKRAASGPAALRASRVDVADPVVASDLTNYGLEDYKRVNAALADADGGELPDGASHYTRRSIASIDGVMRPSTRDIVVSRGITADGASAIFGPLDRPIPEGFEWTERRFSSTSTHAPERLGAVFAGGGGVRMRILVPQGTRVISTPPGRFRGDPGTLDPDEVLLQRDLRFRVVADRGVDADGVRRLDVEVVPRPGSAQPGDTARGKAALKVPPHSLEALTAAGDPRAAALHYRNGDNSLETRTRRPGSVEQSEAMRPGGWRFAHPETKAHVRMISSLMRESKLPQAIEVYHGTDQYFAQRWRVGREFTIPTFVATSTDREYSEKYGYALLRIHVPAGTSAIRMADIPGEEPESQILLDRKLVYRVTGEQEIPVKTLSNGRVLSRRVLDVEVVPARTAGPAEKAAKAPAKKATRPSPGARALSPPTGRFGLATDRGQSGDGRAPGGQWGRYGAAGVLIRSNDGDEPRFLLLKTGSWVDAGGKWQLPGGAIDEKETPYQGVSREAHEEIGAPADYVAGLRPVGELIHQPDKDWRYTTIAADSNTRFEPRVDGDETTEARWLTAEEIDDLIARDQVQPDLARTLRPIIDSYPAPARGKAAKGRAKRPGRDRDLTADPAVAGRVLAAIRDMRARRDRGERLDDDPALAAITAERGFDGPPRVVAPTRMDALVGREGWTELWRRVDSPEHAEELRTGAMWHGRGSVGSGIYTSADRSAVERFGGAVEVRLALRPDARTITIDEVRDLIRQRQGSWSDDERAAWSDPGRYAAALGFDAITPNPTPRPDGRAQSHVVLNRTALAAEGPARPRAKPKTAGREPGGAGRKAGRDLLAPARRDLVAGRARRAGDRGPHGDEALHAIAVEQGWTGQPRQVDKATLDALIAGGQPELWRGVEDRAHADQLVAGEPYYGSNVDYGSGISASVDRMTARTYGDELTRMTLAPGSRVVDLDEVIAERDEFLAGLADSDPARELFRDPGRFAAARGVDAIRVHYHDGAIDATEGDGRWLDVLAGLYGVEAKDLSPEDLAGLQSMRGDHYIALNRTALVVDTDSSSLSPRVKARPGAPAAKERPQSRAASRRHVAAVNEIPAGPDGARRHTSAELRRQADITPKTARELRATLLPDPGSPEDEDWRAAAQPGIVAGYLGQRGDGLGGRTGPTIVLDPAWRDPDATAAAVASARRAGLLFPIHDGATPADELRAIVAHEYGHHVVEMFASNPALGDPDAWPATRVDRLAGPLARHLGVGPPEGGDAASWVAANEAAIAREVSGHGASSWRELLAEAWGEWTVMGDDARPVARLLGPVMRDMAEGPS